MAITKRWWATKAEAMEETPKAAIDENHLKRPDIPRHCFSYSWLHWWSCRRCRHCCCRVHCRWRFLPTTLLLSSSLANSDILSMLKAHYDQFFRFRNLECSQRNAIIAISVIKDIKGISWIYTHANSAVCLSRELTFQKITLFRLSRRMFDPCAFSTFAL